MIEADKKREMYNQEEAGDIVKDEH